METKVSPSGRLPSMEGERYLKVWTQEVLDRINAYADTNLSDVGEDVIYARRSIDREGKKVSVGQQIKNSRGIATVDIPDEAVFSDDDISASTLSKKPRPEFEQMLARVVQGKVKRIWAYSNSRITRRPLELDLLINFHQAYGVEYKTVVSGQDNLSTADGRMVGRIKAAVDAAEAEKTSERRMERHKADAEAGKKHQGRYRTYGYNRDRTIVPDEAAVVKEAFQRKADGESLSGIARDFNNRDIFTVTGKPWTASNMSKMLSKSEYAGLITLHGEVVAKAEFESIVDEVTYHKANDNLSTAAQPGKNARQHVLSGFLVCSKCLATMKGNAARGGRYTCPAPPRGCGKCVIKMTETDVAVFNAAWMKMQDEPLPETETVDMSAEIERIESDIQTIQDDKELQPIDKVPLLKTLRAELAKAMTEAAKMPAAPSYIDPMIDWEYKMNLSQKRLWLAKYIKNVIVHPSTHGARYGYDVERLEVFFTDGTSQRLTKGVMRDIIGG